MFLFTNFLSSVLFVLRVQGGTSFAFVGRQVCTPAICLVDTWRATPCIYRPLLSIDTFSVKIVDTWQAVQGVPSIYRSLLSITKRKSACGSSSQ